MTFDVISEGGYKKGKDKSKVSQCIRSVNRMELYHENVRKV